MSSGTEEPRTRQNPFSSMAVAKITGFGDSDSPDLTIETESVRRASAHLDDYLSSPVDENSPGGDVIVLVGDYGTGKTHLAMELVRRAENTLGSSTQAMYLDTTADDFVVLHRRFMDKLGLEGIRARVSEYYARIVADSLEENDLGAHFLNLFQAGDLTPQDAVNRLGLMESALLRYVRQALLRVTANESFGTALTLLLRTGFDAAVWDWLTGKEPAQILVERGITNAINTEDAALEAMGVVAMLYGGQHARFVLVIDEMERIFAGSEPRGADTVGFQKLLEVFANAGAFLVLSGLPEFYDMLDASVRQRVSHVVQMAGLTTAEIGHFIRLAQKAKFGRDEIRPFTEDTIGYLRNLTGGVPRRVIRLCHEVYRIYDDERHHTGDEDLLVSDDMVREAMRRQAGLLSSDDIHGVVRNILHAHGWRFLQNHLLGTAESSRADFWVTFEDRVGGCAVLITGPVLAEEDAAEVRRRITAVLAAARDAVVVLVVNGALDKASVKTVGEGLAAEPLVYAERGFSEAFGSLVAVMNSRLRHAPVANPVINLQQRLEQFNRQQVRIYEFARKASQQLDEMREVSDRRLVAIEHELRAASAGSPTEATLTTAKLPLPPEVDQHFLDALDALAELTQIDAMMTDVFLGSDNKDIVDTVQGRLSQNEVLEATGVAFMIRAAVTAFRTAVADWQRVSSRAQSYRADVAARRLDVICQTYDDVIEFLPIHKLWPLIRLSPWQGHTFAAHRQRRYDRVQETLVSLSPLVRRSMARAALAVEE
jgi:Cdc6-like AAA superfamily ATPase